MESLGRQKTSLQILIIDIGVFNLLFYLWVWCFFLRGQTHQQKFQLLEHDLNNFQQHAEYNLQ
jgi:hypothetical protein